jgi:hypothetical protein
MGRTDLVAAELRVTLASLDDWPLLLSMLSLAGERSVVDGAPVRCLSGTYLPDDGRLLCVFVAPTVDSVRRLLRSTSLPTMSVGPAVALTDLDPRSDAA